MLLSTFASEITMSKEMPSKNDDGPGQCDTVSWSTVLQTGRSQVQLEVRAHA